MKKFNLFLICAFCQIIATSTIAKAQDADTVSFRFANTEEASKLVGADDSFTLGWSDFDIISRLQNPNGTREDLLAFRQREVREWTEEEKQLILQDMLELNKIIRAEGYELPFPKEVILVKSTMKDEGNAGGYTQSNWIALSANYLERAGDDNRRKLLLHELSHILTRNSFSYKQKLYSALGFNVVPEGLAYPEFLVKRRISNPDIAAYDSYGPFKINGKTENCAMYLYTDRDWDKGEFFEYVRIAFVPYDDDLKPKTDAQGKVIIYDISEVEDFTERVGKNTNYIIHPEEILAENFVLAFLNKTEVPTPRLIEKIRNILTNK